MSLTAQDLMQIRAIFREENKPLQDEIQAMHNDIKEIYDRLGKIENRLNKIESRLDRLEIAVMPDKDFAKLSTEAKLLRLNSELLAAAKEVGLDLPR